MSAEPRELTEVEKAIADTLAECQRRLREVQKPLTAMVLDLSKRLEPYGYTDHSHGNATFADPMWWHRHPYTDEAHVHDPLPPEAVEQQERAWENMP